MTPELTINNASSGAAATQGGVAAGEKGIAVGGNVEGGIHYHEAPSTPMLRATPPPPPPHFTGREDELAKFTQLLTSGENVAITALQGMGGIGKTALAQKLAEELQHTCDPDGRPYFPGGVLWWTLGPNPDVITALDVWARHADPRADLSALPTAESRANIVRAMLARLAKLCVIIDDAWTEASARTLMSAVPPHCPVLITTRDGDLAKALRCHVERIDALSVDEAVAMLTKLLGPLGKYEAAAREIAQLTEGLPLALELIYGLADSPADLPALAKQLREKPMLNILKLPGDEVREKSIEACLAMSYTALDADMQRRFRALGVFAPAPFDRAAIAAVWAEDEDTVDAALKQLVRRSLLTRSLATPSLAKVSEPSQGSVPEYRQHALLHAYALALLEIKTPTPTPPPFANSANKGGDNSLPLSDAFPDGGRSKTPNASVGAGDGGSAFASRHADYYRRFAKAQDWRAIEHAFDQIDWGWRWVQANALDLIFDYIDVVQKFLDARGNTVEAIKWLQVGLIQAHMINDRKREGTFLNDIGTEYYDLGQLKDAIVFYMQSLDIRHQIGDRRGESATRANIAGIYYANNKILVALDYYQQALDIAREVGERHVEGAALNYIGIIYGNLDQNQEALEMLQNALDIRREVGDRIGEGETLNNIGEVYAKIGQWQDALEYHEQSLSIFRATGHRRNTILLLSNIFQILVIALGRDDDEAISYLEQAVALEEEIDHPDLERDRAILENVRRKLRGA